MATVNDISIICYAFILANVTIGIHYYASDEIQQTQNINPMYDQCWDTVYNAGVIDHTFCQGVVFAELET